MPHIQSAPHVLLSTEPPTGAFYTVAADRWYAFLDALDLQPGGNTFLPGRVGAYPAGVVLEALDRLDRAFEQGRASEFPGVLHSLRDALRSVAFDARQVCGYVTWSKPR